MRGPTTLWEQVAREQERAEHSRSFADRHERLVSGATADRPLHERMAAFHHRNERRHVAVSDLYCCQALRTTLRTAEADGLPPRFPLVADVGRTVGARAAVLTVVDIGSFETLVLASGPAARRAQELEFSLGEGPVCDVLRHRQPVAANGPQIAERWLAYGPEIGGLGFYAVAAIPLNSDNTLAGTLVLFDPQLPLSANGHGPVAEHLGNALVRVLGGGARGEVPAGSDDRRTAVHEAAKLVALRYGCSLDEAGAVLRVRAFAEHRPVHAVVRAVVEGRPVG